MNDDLAIYRDLILVSPNGDKSQIRVGFTKPEIVSRTSATVVVCMAPFHLNGKKFSGLDGWQAALSVMHLIYVELKAQESAGYKFLFLDGEPFDLDYFLPTVGRALP